MTTNEQLISMLLWQLEAGADEVIDETSQASILKYENNFDMAEKSKNSEISNPPAPDHARTNKNALIKKPTRTYSSPQPAGDSDSHAAALAGTANTLSQLRLSMEKFDECSLKHTAINLVFSDGNPKARVMFIGEAPGVEEDRKGIPFVGASGQLLDRMIGAIGLDRSNTYITNIIPWRPPGNRKPTTQEIITCLPFVHRHIQLVNPEILVLVGGTAANALLERTESISRLRGKWLVYRENNREDCTELPTISIYHPAYLLRHPAGKRETWRDFLSIQNFLVTLKTTHR